MNPDPQERIAPEMRAELLRFSRAVASWILAGLHGPGPSRPTVHRRFGGAFVTFYSGQSLRGCVGSFATSDDLAAVIEDVTAASLADPRFESNRVTLDELAELTIEISVLTELVRAQDPLALVPGRHGIVIRSGARSGCFLPKVAAERGWTAEEFLSNCCTMKAQLPASAWRDGNTLVYCFEAEVFSDPGVAAVPRPDCG